MGCRHKANKLRYNEKGPKTPRNRAKTPQKALTIAVFGGVRAFGFLTGVSTSDGRLAICIARAIVTTSAGYRCRHNSQSNPLPVANTLAALGVARAVQNPRYLKIRKVNAMIRDYATSGSRGMAA